VVVKKIPTPEEREAAIDAETDRLAAWAMNDDPESLSNILGDLASPEKEIRMAAIEAAKQFESTNAIPVLKAAAANAEDNEEAIAMLEAADWLALPNADLQRPDTMPQLTPAQTQAIEQSRAKAQARRQAYLQKRAGNQGSQSSPGQSAAPPPDPN
jgi:HEAT repeat protein